MPLAAGRGRHRRDHPQDCSTCRTSRGRPGDGKHLVDRIKHPQDEVTIDIVGKYVGLEDSYKSLNEALLHGGFRHRLKVNLKWIEAEALEAGRRADTELNGADGILVPGGFGNRGTRGMIQAVRIRPRAQIPFFGICFGFQWAVIEFARNVCGLTGADSTEFAPDTPDQGDLQAARSARRGRAGRHDAPRRLRLPTQAGLARPQALRQPTIYERHRHRYEFN